MPKKGTEGAKGRVTNSQSHKRYIGENREQKNKIRTLEKHLKAHPTDRQAEGGLARTLNRAPYRPPTKAYVIPTEKPKKQKRA